jgi:pimeloyl-ACP methyl ester carboxylesterase
MAADISSTMIFPKLLRTSKGCKGELVETIRSKDGTTIAFDRLGDGPPVIVVGGLLGDRALTRPTAEELATHFTVFNYDRRGRGDSGDTAPYAIEREIEDIGALIAEAGGTASVYAHSSGAGLGFARGGARPAHHQARSA